MPTAEANRSLVKLILNNLKFKVKEVFCGTSSPTCRGRSIRAAIVMKRKGEFFLKDLNLQNIPLFRGLSQPETEKFVKLTGTTFKRYPKGERVLEAFAPNANIGVLVEGTAQILTLDRTGNESVGHGLDCGAMFGTTSAILPGENSTTSIQLTSEALIMWIPYRSLLIAGPKLGHTHGIVMKNLLETFARKNFLMMQKIEILTQKSLREKIILYLFQREKHFPDEKIKIPGRVHFAKELECNRSALTREISLMQAEGLIFCEGDTMKLNKEKLL